MSTAQISGFQTILINVREDISKSLDQGSPFVGNAMSSINACLDNLNNESVRVEKEATLLAEREAKNLEEARKVVAAADAAAKAARAPLKDSTPAANPKAPTA